MGVIPTTNETLEVAPQVGLSIEYIKKRKTELDEVLRGSLSSLESLLAKPFLPSEDENFRRDYLNYQLYTSLAYEIRKQIKAEEERLSKMQDRRERERTEARLEDLRRKLKRFKREADSIKDLLKSRGEMVFDKKSQERREQIEAEVYSIKALADTFKSELLASDVKKVLVKKWVEVVKARVSRNLREKGVAEDIISAFNQIIDEFIEAGLNHRLNQNKKEELISRIYSLKMECDYFHYSGSDILAALPEFGINDYSPEIDGLASIDRLLELLFTEYTTKYVNNLALILKRNLPEEEYKRISDWLRAEFFPSYSFDFKREAFVEEIEYLFLDQFRVLSEEELVRDLFGEEIVEGFKRRLGRQLLKELFKKLKDKTARTYDETRMLLYIKDPGVVPYAILAALSDSGYSGEMPFINSDRSDFQLFLDYLEGLSEKEIEGLSKFGIISKKELIEMLERPWDDKGRLLFLKNVALQALQNMESEEGKLLALRLLKNVSWENLEGGDIGLLLDLYKQSTSEILKSRIVELASYMDDDNAKDFMRRVLSELGREDLMDILASHIEISKLKFHFDNILLLCEIGLDRELLQAVPLTISSLLRGAQLEEYSDILKETFALEQGKRNQIFNWLEELIKESRGKGDEISTYKLISFLTPFGKNFDKVRRIYNSEDSRIRGLFFKLLHRLLYTSQASGLLILEDIINIFSSEVEKGYEGIIRQLLEKYIKESNQSWIIATVVEEGEVATNFLIDMYWSSDNIKIKRNIADSAGFIKDEELSTRFMKSILSMLGKEDLIDKLRSQMKEWETSGVNRGFIEKNFGNLVFLCEVGLGENLDFRKFNRLLNRASFIFYYPGEELREVVRLLGITSSNITYISRESFSYITTHKDMFPLFKIVLTQRPTQFNNFVESFRVLYPGRFGGNIDEAVKKVQEMLRHSSVIIPSLLKAYLEGGLDKAMELQQRIERALDIIFSNTPIEDLNLPEETLKEVIVYAFPGASLSDVERFLPLIREGVERDIEEFDFPEEGYFVEMSLDRELVYRLKEGEKVDEGLRNILIEFLKKTEEDKKEVGVKSEETERKRILQEVRKILKRAGAARVEDGVALLREFLREKLTREGKYELVIRLVESPSEDLWARGILEIKDLFSKVFRESFVEWLKKKIERGEIFISPKRLNQIKSEFLGGRGSQINRDDRFALENALKYLRSKEANISNKEEALAIVVATILKYRILERRKGDGILQKIKRELNKFETTTGKSLEKGNRLALRFYVSKNRASFFAKFSAGICTKGDDELFNRQDHFHINMVDPGTKQCVGNIQGYRIEYNGKRALLFRGFNPSESLLLEYPPELLGEIMVEAIRRFAKDNGIQDVFVSEQLGRWYALSNSNDIFSFFSKRFLNPSFPGFEEVRLDSGFSIADGATISRMYRVPLEVRATPVREVGKRG